MSKRDPHYLLMRQAELDGWSPAKHGDFNHDEFTAVQQAKFALNGPEARAKSLHDLDNAIGAEDGSSLRAKSDLVRLRQDLSRCHQALLKAGR
jgi:hypothetical protein